MGNFKRTMASFLGGASLSLFVLIAPAMAAPAPATNPRARAEELAAAIVQKLTLDEKVGQLVNVAPAIPRLGIPAYNWWTESLHGAIGTVPTTNFPEPIGLAATFDDALVGDVASAISGENRGLHALARQTGHLGRIGTGLDTWSPNINIFRDPRWGRGQETYGEDPFLTARMGVAYVTGMQGPDPDLPDVISTPKHYRRAQRTGIDAPFGKRRYLDARPRRHLSARLPRRDRAKAMRARSCAPITASTASRPAPTSCC